ncbi:NAD(P)-dependent alcohol dehydrogenase [Rhodococcus sp. WS1]|uniref:NAD(P)-dependent alcohol dehydrogenase n=1 Tax=unclassified Rhodococcus (in: high G+C Gram-positive bacteria) TaxID=192944 RepID=UPI00114223CB|nr:MULTISPECIES: NAD(P)-dependent alcohol dehydrogenase [unclassified Rhodococcus (in: high G+C Gram-positive bacteria)]ROZ52779.1 NAD(P)-dependent alcohol dehydrogenase [Rhodococcus sp. WS1]TQC34303.1 NAD(P)-dependent alcohol dehydrogenase [Rhodococcus sp. WS7]
MSDGNETEPVKTLAAVHRSGETTLSLEALSIASPRANEVLVDIVGSGICHTDLGVIATDDAGPIVLGHEGSGVVRQIGADVTTLNPGDHVVLSFNHCGTCDNCVAGVPGHCRTFVASNLTGSRVDGSTPLTTEEGDPVRGHFFGQSSWSHTVVTTEWNCVKVDKDLPLELLGPLGCGIQTGAGAVLNTLNPEPDSSIAIFGAGSVGMAAILGAVVAECATIIAVDIDHGRLEAARELGATHTIDSSTTDPVHEIRLLTGGYGARYSVECIGLPAVVKAAVECLQSPGVCASVGFQGATNNVTIDQGHLLFGRTLVGVIEGDAVPTEFITRMISLYQAGKFPFDRLIETFPFGEINAALEAVHKGSVIKAVLTMDGV